MRLGGEEEEDEGGGATSRRKRKQRMQAFTTGPAPPSGGSDFAANGFPAGGSSPHSLLPSTTPPADGVGRQGLLPWGG
jgi:hypothetical protein